MKIIWDALLVSVQNVCKPQSFSATRDFDELTVQDMCMPADLDMCLPGHKGLMW